MSLYFSWQRLLFAATLGAIGGLVIAAWPRSHAPDFYLEITFRVKASGLATLHHGFDPAAKSIQLRAESERDEVLKFPLPQGRYLNLPLDPTDQPGNTVTISSARVVDWSGTVLKTMGPGRFKALDNTTHVEATDAAASVTSNDANLIPHLIIELERPLVLTSPSRPLGNKFLRRLAFSFTIAGMLGYLLAPILFPALSRIHERSFTICREQARRHPTRIVLAAAAASVVLSCYPVIFFGKSFLSPNNHHYTRLLYGEMPTVPGASETSTDDEKGSDLGAAMWYSWPTSVVQSRALFKDGQLPLWNRYDSGGLPLFGQGQSMFGDPLHLLVLLGHGAAGWWDLKYLLAKFLFAAAVGLCVWQLTRHLPAALTVAFSASFIGFFSYRYSHPAFFSLCYAPLIYLAWIRFTTAATPRQAAWGTVAMIAANWCVLNSGTVKEAYTLLLMMNVAGGLTLLFSNTNGKSRKVVVALAAQVLFILISAPVWMTFLHTLRSSWTFYTGHAAYQIPPSLLIGLFDDIFYRQFNANELHVDPSGNFLILGGVLWFCLSRNRGRGWLGPGVTCLLALAIVFGVVPTAFIARIPFLAQVYHVDDTFSGAAIVCLLVLTGFGLKAFADDCSTPVFKQTVIRVSIAMVCLLALYFATSAGPRPFSRIFFEDARDLSKSSFFWGYSVTLVAALAVAIVAARSLVLHSRNRWSFPAIVLALVLLHWRHGMHLHTPFDAYVMNPHARADLQAGSSPALRLLSTKTQDPARVVGLGDCLSPGYGGPVGLEQIDSVDPLLNPHYKSLLDNFDANLVFATSERTSGANRLANNLPLFDLLNVRYFLGSSPDKSVSSPSLKKIASVDLNVYESSKAWPRAFFTDGCVFYDDEKMFADLLKKAGGVPFAAIPREELGEFPVLKTLPDRAAATFVPATDYSLTSNTTSFKVAASGRGIVVLTEPYIRGDFRVRVNGQPTDYFRINGAFKGILLPEAGEYAISFSYWPAHFALSLCLAGAGLLAVFPLFVVAGRKT